MSDDTQQPIVVKRIKKGGGGHHGGAWKIAYADFVTAMMAFFLMMWLLGSTAQGDLQGIADHFQNPLKVSLHGGSGTGDSSSVIQGGGEDLTRSLGQVKRGDVEGRRAINLDAAKGCQPESYEGDTPSRDHEEERRERGRLLDLKGKIEAIVEADAKLRPFKNQILIDITTEGLRIQLVDEQNRPMFASASADLRPYMRDLLRAIGRVLNDVPNRLSLSGHTDAAPFAGGERGFSNWELSANRANASRREMIAGGLEPTRVIRVVGLSDMIPLNAKDPLDPINRRISIIVLNRKTEEALLAESAARAANGTANGGGSGTGPDSAPAGDASNAMPRTGGAAAPQPPAAVVSPGG